MKTGNGPAAHGRRPRRRWIAGAGAGLTATLALVFTLPGAASGATPTAVEGVDVSHYQAGVNWQTLWNRGARWAYVKATQGTAHRDPAFAQQYAGAYRAGMIRGSYHFAIPNASSGATQANFFAAHGGGWSKGGRTLPGALDLEYNPYGSTCYGKSHASMVSWIRDFLNTYKARTGRNAVVYTTTSWWTRCTGNYAGFGATNPLWIARYRTAPGTLPAGWKTYTFWQYTETGSVVGDHDRFRGTPAQLKTLALG
jgi:GH25 family lysozyme M1 (1,4-beta-N-acetylmuramidase)